MDKAEDDISLNFENEKERQQFRTDVIAEELKQELDDLIYLQWRSNTMRKHVWGKINEYAQQEKEQYAYQQAMAYEAWLCEIGATKTISAKPDYTNFLNHQNRQ